jgi:hypothetical protein
MTKRTSIAGAAVERLAAAYVATRPAAFAIERTERVAAPPAVVYGRIASLRARDVWSPWVHLDAKRKLAHASPDRGAGARSEREGSQVGRGPLALTAVAPPRAVEMRLDLLAPSGAGTRIARRMGGRDGFLGRPRPSIVDMDEAIGVPLEQGLVALRDVAEVDSREET